MNEDGTMARVPQLEAFCREHDLKMITVKDLIQYRMKHERLVRKMAEANLPTSYGALPHPRLREPDRRRTPRGLDARRDQPGRAGPGARPLASA